MYRKTISLLKLLPALLCLLITSGCTASATPQANVQDMINNSAQPVIEQYQIPGMAIAVTINGKHHFYNYGVMSKETQQPITKQTLFEIGSLSKTFTATLASYAQVNGTLSLTDNVSTYLPALQGSNFDNISLLHLGTHTSGGLPLQVPDHVTNTTQLMEYFSSWQPTYQAGTHRSYSNLSIGMLGMITAQSMNESFDDAMEKRLFPELGITNSYINVPANKMKDYAQGYNKQDMPVRLNGGVLASEAYGLKSNTVDLIRFIETNMHVVKLNKKLQQAIDDTHIGYFQAGEMTQDLIWEQYPYPAELEQLLAGNASTMVSQSTIVTELNPPLEPQQDVLINKTGSTNGFSTYAAFIPAKKLGIVILANKSYPIDARIQIAHQILTQLANQTSSQN